MSEIYSIHFPEGYSGRREEETPVKGWVDVVVSLSTGSSYPLAFYDLDRLIQTARDELATGRAYYAEPNLVLLNEVTTENVENAVAEMVARGFFDTAIPS